MLSPQAANDLETVEHSYYPHKSVLKMFDFVIESIRASMFTTKVKKPKRFGTKGVM